MTKTETRIIAVTGGKGGTGKSTFAILYGLKAVAEGKKVLLVDCDVECPNDHIILGLDLSDKPVSKTYAQYPAINEKLCRKCGICVQKCPSNAIFQSPGEIPNVMHDMCSSCAVCWNICPHKAIEPVKEQNGMIYRNEVSSGMVLVTGMSIPGVRETSPVVTQTREFVCATELGTDDSKEKEPLKKRQNEGDFDLCIIDTSAGTHCTVISALDGCDEAYAVTEPTPMGKHDLNVILDVIYKLDIPPKIVVNQYDRGDFSLIDTVAKQRTVPIAYEIPYSKELAKAYSSGELLSDTRLVDLIANEEKR